MTEGDVILHPLCMSSQLYNNEEVHLPEGTFKFLVLTIHDLHKLSSAAHKMLEFEGGTLDNH